jgi:hypothetical protein
VKYVVRAAGKLFDVEAAALNIVYNDDTVEFIDKDGTPVFVAAKHAFESAALEPFAGVKKTAIPENK